MYGPGMGMGGGAGGPMYSSLLFFSSIYERKKSACLQKKTINADKWLSKQFDARCAKESKRDF